MQKLIPVIIVVIILVVIAISVMILKENRPEAFQTPEVSINTNSGEVKVDVDNPDTPSEPTKQDENTNLSENDTKLLKLVYGESMTAPDNGTGYEKVGKNLLIDINNDGVNEVVRFGNFLEGEVVLSFYKLEGEDTIIIPIPGVNYIGKIYQTSDGLYFTDMAADGPEEWATLYKLEEYSKEYPGMSQVTNVLSRFVKYDDTDSSKTVEQYEVNGKTVSKEEFEAELKRLSTNVKVEKTVGHIDWINGLFGYIEFNMTSYKDIVSTPYFPSNIDLDKKYKIGTTQIGRTFVDDSECDLYYYRTVALDTEDKECNVDHLIIENGNSSLDLIINSEVWNDEYSEFITLLNNNYLATFSNTNTGDTMQFIEVYDSSLNKVDKEEYHRHYNSETEPSNAYKLEATPDYIRYSKGDGNTEEVVRYEMSYNASSRKVESKEISRSKEGYGPIAGRT